MKRFKNTSGCEHVRRYRKTEQAVLGRELNRVAGSNCNHARQYGELERQYYKNPKTFITWKSFDRCKHGVESYCKQCLADTPEHNSQFINLDLTPIRATIDAPTINRPVNPYLESKETSKANTMRYRMNNKGNKPFNALNALSEIAKFRTLRKSALYSIQRYCYRFDFRFDTGLFEDSFQEAVLEYYQTGDKAQSENYLKGHLNKRTRKHYARLSRQLNDTSLDQILTETFETGIEEFTAINYTPNWQQRQKADDRFKRECKEVFTDRQNKLIDLKLKGYSDERIAGVFNVSRRTITTDRKKLKLAFTAGVFA